MPGPGGTPGRGRRHRAAVPARAPRRPGRTAAPRAPAPAGRRNRRSAPRAGPPPRGADPAPGGGRPTADRRPEAAGGGGHGGAPPRARRDSPLHSAARTGPIGWYCRSQAEAVLVGADDVLRRSEHDNEHRPRRGGTGGGDDDGGAGHRSEQGSGQGDDAPPRGAGLAGVPGRPRSRTRQAGGGRTRRGVRPARRDLGRLRRRCGRGGGRAGRPPRRAGQQRRSRRPATGSGRRERGPAAGPVRGQRVRPGTGHARFPAPPARVGPPSHRHGLQRARIPDLRRRPRTSRVPLPEPGLRLLQDRAQHDRLPVRPSTARFQGQRRRPRATRRPT